MPHVLNGKMFFTFEEAQEIINTQREEDAIEVARIICERRRLN